MLNFRHLPTWQPKKKLKLFHEINTNFHTPTQITSNTKALYVISQENFNYLKLYFIEKRKWNSTFLEFERDYLWRVWMAIIMLLLKVTRTIEILKRSIKIAFLHISQWKSDNIIISWRLNWTSQIELSSTRDQNANIKVLDKKMRK